MTRAATMITAVAVVCLVAGLAAQTPSFAGRWTTDPAPAGATPAGTGQAGPARGGGGGAGGRGDMGSGWGSSITITQDAAQLTVEFSFFGRGDMQPPLRFVYALDGSATTNSVMMGRGVQTQKSTTAWAGEKLVITTVHMFVDPATGKPAPVEVKQTLWLESAAALVVEASRAGLSAGPPTSTRTVYRKQ